MNDVGERELLAIIFTDAVDSTARTASDEDYSLRILLADLDYMRNEAAVRGGTVLKNTGDGLLISFKSAVDAVECALSIQRGFANRAENSAFTHKIGVHIGDVIKKDGDIYGSGVNTASRLVAQCPAGSLCMSSTLYELVKQKSQIGQLKVRDFQLTNIEPPIKAYRLEEASDKFLPPAPFKKIKTGGIFGALNNKTALLLVFLGGLIFIAGLLAAKVSPTAFYLISHQGADNDLSGIWKDSLETGQGKIYITQSGDKIFWFAEERKETPEYAYVLFGRIVGQHLNGEFADIPKGKNRSLGKVKLKIENKNELRVVEASGGWPLHRSYLRQEIIKDDNIAGTWIWLGGGIIRFDSFGNGIEVGKEEELFLTYEKVDSKENMYRIRWFSKRSGDNWFTDYLCLKNGDNLLEGKNIAGQAVFANRKR